MHIYIHVYRNHIYYMYCPPPKKLLMLHPITPLADDTWSLLEHEDGDHRNLAQHGLGRLDQHKSNGPENGL